MIICGGSGGKSGGGGGSTNGDAGQPGEVVRVANQMTEAQRADAFIEKLMAERKAKEAKKAAPTRYERMQGGSSTRDEGPSGGQMSNAQIARNAAKLKAASKNLKTEGWGGDYNPYG